MWCHSHQVDILIINNDKLTTAGMVAVMAACHALPTKQRHPALG
jgi:hypothetical protein